MNSFYQKEVLVPSLLKIGSGEIYKIGKYLKEHSFKVISCFYSEGITNIIEPALSNSLKEYKIELLHSQTPPEINIESIIDTAFKIPKKVEVILGIGGGKAIDYAKYAAHVLDLPFISIPTSTSNDGFCSPQSSLLVDGKRKSVNARLPYGVIADIDIIKSAPEYSIYAGIGDLVSKFTAVQDWQQAIEKKLSTDAFHDFAHVISYNTVVNIMDSNVSNIRANDFIYKLINALLMNGVSMAIAGSSRPASGSEHLISHALDKISAKPAMHGLQVGIATYVCSHVQNNKFYDIKNFLTATGFLKYMAQHPINKQEFIEAVKTASSIKEDFYTMLSDPINVQKAIEFINSDEILKKVLI